MSGEVVTTIVTSIGQVIILLGYINHRMDRLEDKIGVVDDNVESLERSVHADFVEHLRREHNLGNAK
jgi:hypothetical protein